MEGNLEFMQRGFAPKLGIIVVVVFLVVAAVFLVSKRNETSTINSSASGNPKYDSTLAANAEKSGDVGEYYDGFSASASATPVPSPANIKVYTYPGAVVKSSAAKKLTLESSDSSEKVTEWYKKLIQDSRFNAKSFSQVMTNGDVLNMLSAAKPGEKIEITIKKDQSTSKTLITVDRS